MGAGGSFRVKAVGESKEFHVCTDVPGPSECVEFHVQGEVSQCIDVLFICDEWGSSKGGLSTFNREFAVNLAKASRERLNIHCYVCSSSEGDRQDAIKQGVNLITARRVPGSDPIEWLKRPPPELQNPDIVVGHGRKFGGAAYFISDRTKCKWIHFVHVFCEDLGKHKLEGGATADAIAENEKKNKQELELCEAAHLVVAVGTELQEKYIRRIPEIKVITPGLFEQFLIDGRQPHRVQKRFRVFMFGRGSFEDFALKGYDIIGDAVASLGRKYELTFVGSPQYEQRSIESWFIEKTKIARNQLTIRGYCDYQEMKKMFREADVIVMPSRTEGFGLVALEAISASVPVLVSSECGIAKALEEVEGGMSVVVESDRPQDWSGRIKQLSQQKPKDRHESALHLREQYGNVFTWQNECAKFEKMILELVQRPDKAVPSSFTLKDQYGNVTMVKVEPVVSAEEEVAQTNRERNPLTVPDRNPVSSTPSTADREAKQNEESDSQTDPGGNPDSSTPSTDRGAKQNQERDSITAQDGGDPPSLTDTEVKRKKEQESPTDPERNLKTKQTEWNVKEGSSTTGFSSVSQSIDVLFICDEWGSSKGGLSTFNREFAVNLAKASNERLNIHCYVCSSSEEDRQDASKHGVNLITARRLPGSVDLMEGLKIPPPELQNPDIVVGHGRKFGGAAYFISERTKCKWIHFVHEFCEDLGKHKLEEGATADAIAESEEKNKRELELCEAADVVVAVGSQLQRKYSRLLPDIRVEVITPGMFENFVIQREVKFLQAEEFSVSMFSRGSFEDFVLKGYDIIGDAVGSLGRKYGLTFVGSPQGKQKKIQNWFFNKTKIAKNQLTIRGYCDFEEIKKMFREADVIVMPSRTEGFGLVALEAISAGVPVLVSSECGIAKTLKDVKGGKSVVVNSDKPEEWARRIHDLSELKAEERNARAIHLREQYGKTYSWKKECTKFEQMIHELVQSPHRAGLTAQDGNTVSLSSSTNTRVKENKERESPTDADHATPIPLDRKRATSNKGGVLPTGSEFMDKDKKEWNSLHSAARDGDVTKIESLLSRGFSVDCIDSITNEGLTALMIAAANDKLQAVEYLLAKGANPSLENSDGLNSLHLASYGGNTDIIELMLSHVPSIDAIDNEGVTALMLATFNGKLQAVEYLLAKGANPSLEDKIDGWNTLHVASYGGNTAAIEKILSYGVDIESRTKDGSTPLMIAQERGQDGKPISPTFSTATAAKGKSLTDQYGNVTTVKVEPVVSVDEEVTQTNRERNPLTVPDRNPVSSTPSTADREAKQNEERDSQTDPGGHTVSSTPSTDRGTNQNKDKDPLTAHDGSKVSPSSLTVTGVKQNNEQETSTDSDKSTASQTSSECGQEDSATDQDVNTGSPSSLTDTREKRKTGEVSVDSDESTSSQTSKECTEEDSTTDSDESTASQTSEYTEQVSSTGSEFMDKDKKEWNSLHSVARDGDVTKIESLLSRGFSVDCRDGRGITPLMVAAGNGKLQAVEYLLKKGANPSLENSDGLNSLHWASQGGNPDIIELMLSHVPSIDSINNEGTTALMLAAANDKLQAVEYLLEKGANPSLEDNNGWNLLHWASQGGNPVIIELMLSHVPSIDSINNRGVTALMVAARLGKLQAVEYLLEKGANPSLEDNNGWNLLHSASQGGNPVIIELMLSHVPSIDSITNEGLTALMIAAANDKLQAVEYLLAKGANPLLEDNDGWNLLHWASQGGNPDIIELMLSHVPSIDSITNGGVRALMVAAANGKLQAVEYLLAKGANPSLEDNEGGNLLHWASLCGNTAVIEKILSYGVDIESRTKDGLTPLMVAQWKGKAEAVTYLLSKGAKPS
ncbi:uncharacterized protein LOC144665185 [Oculina patagonica]